MKKQLNTDAIANELRELSPFFRRATPEQAALPPAEEQSVQQTGPDESARKDQKPIQPNPGNQDRTTRTGGTPRPSRTPRTPRTGLPPVKRHMKRHSFEIYFDQYESLVRLAAAERLDGGVGSMSQMVREAIDRLIAERSEEHAA